MIAVFFFIHLHVIGVDSGCSFTAELCDYSPFFSALGRVLRPDSDEFQQIIPSLSGCHGRPNGCCSVKFRYCNCSNSSNNSSNCQNGTFEFSKNWCAENSYPPLCKKTTWSNWGACNSCKQTRSMNLPSACFDSSYSNRSGIVESDDTLLTIRNVTDFDLYQKSLSCPQTVDWRRCCSYTQPGTCQITNKSKCKGRKTLLLDSGCNSSCAQNMTTKEVCSDDKLCKGTAIPSPSTRATTQIPATTRIWTTFPPKEATKTPISLRTSTAQPTTKTPTHIIENTRASTGASTKANQESNSTSSMGDYSLTTQSVTSSENSPQSARTPTSTTASSSLSKTIIYGIAGGSGGLILITLIIIVVAIAYVGKRKRRQETSTSTSQRYVIKNPAFDDRGGSMGVYRTTSTGDYEHYYSAPIPRDSSSTDDYLTPVDMISRERHDEEGYECPIDYKA